MRYAADIGLFAHDRAASGEQREDAQARTPDIASAASWSSACASATVWLIFILYVAARGLG